MTTNKQIKMYIEMLYPFSEYSEFNLYQEEFILEIMKNMYVSKKDKAITRKRIERSLTVYKLREHLEQPLRNNWMTQRAFPTGKLRGRSVTAMVYDDLADASRMMDLQGIPNRDPETLKTIYTANGEGE
jgi:hypothetical protein